MFTLPKQNLPWQEKERRGAFKYKFYDINIKLFCALQRYFLGKNFIFWHANENIANKATVVSSTPTRTINLQL